jgi:hypothetical protein
MQPIRLPNIIIMWSLYEYLLQYYSEDSCAHQVVI